MYILYAIVYTILYEFIYIYRVNVCVDQGPVLQSPISTNSGLTTICKIALVIIENDTRWLVENFVLSRYNHRYM